MANISEIKVQGTNYTLRGFENLVEVTSLAGLEANNFYLAKLSAPSDISFKNITSIGEHLRVIIIAQSDFELNWSDEVKSKYVFSNVNKIGFKTGDYALLDITCYPDQTYIYVSTNRFISELVYAEYTINPGISTKLFNDTSNIEYIIIEATGEKISEFGSAGSYSYQFNISGKTKVQINFKPETTADTNGIFNDCPNLIGISDKFLDLIPSVTKLTSTFSGTNIETLPDGLLTPLVDLTNVAGCFSECSKLTSIPDKLFAANKKITAFNTCLAGCTSLESAIPLDDDDTPVYNRGIYKSGHTYPTFYRCFTDCYNMRNYNMVPTLWGGPAGHCPAGFADYGDILLSDGSCYIIDKSAIFNTEIPADIANKAVGVCLGGSNIYSDGYARFIYCGDKSKNLYDTNDNSSRVWASSSNGITAIDASTDNSTVLNSLNGEETSNKILASSWNSKAYAVNLCHSVDPILGKNWYLPSAGELRASWDYIDPNPTYDVNRIIDEVMRKVLSAKYGDDFYFEYGQYGSSAWTSNMYDNTMAYYFIYRKPGMIYQVEFSNANYNRFIYPMVKFDKSSTNADYFNGDKLPGDASLGDYLLKNGTCLSKNTYEDKYKDQIIGICASVGASIAQNNQVFIYIGKNIIKSPWSSELLDSVAPPSSGSTNDASGPINTNAVLDSANLDKYTAYIKTLELGYVKNSAFPRLEGDDGHWFLPSSAFFVQNEQGIFDRDNYHAIISSIEWLNTISGEGSFVNPFATGNKFWMSMQNSDKQPYYVEQAEPPINSQVVKGTYSDSYIILPMVAMNIERRHGFAKDRITINYNNTLGTAAEGYLYIYGGPDIIYSGSLGVFGQTTISTQCNKNAYIAAKVIDVVGTGISNVTINGYTMQADKVQGITNSYDGLTINVTVK